MRIKWIYTAVPLVVWIATAAAGVASDLAADGEADIVAVVNGQPVVTEDVERHLGRVHGAADEGGRSGFDLDRLMIKVVNDILLAQEARAMDLQEEEEVRTKVEAYRVQLATRELERREIAARAQADDDEVRRLFEHQYERATFRVLTAYEEDEAEALRTELDSGTDAATLATEKSVDPYRLRGGLVDNVARIDLQRGVEALVFSLEPGEIGGPVRTDLGWSVVRVESREKADPDRFEPLEAKLGAIVRQTKASELRIELAARLRKEHAVEVDQELVAAIEPNRSPDGRLMPSVSADPAAAVVTVGESHAITAKEYSRALVSRWKGVRNEEAARATAPIVLERLIEARLMEVEAVSRGYDQLPEVARSVRSYETSLLIPIFLEEVVAVGIEVTEVELREHYAAHREEYHRPPRVRLGQITLSSREEAERVAEQLRQGTDLAWLAKRHSTDGFRDKGGDRGWYQVRPDAQEFDRDLLEAPIGTVLDPLGSQDNWLVVKVTDRQEQGIYELEEISGNVRTQAYQLEFLERLDDFIQTLRSRSEIEIREEVLDSMRISGEEGMSDGAGGHVDEGH